MCVCVWLKYKHIVMCKLIDNNIYIYIYELANYNDSLRRRKCLFVCMCNIAFNWKWHPYLPSFGFLVLIEEGTHTHTLLCLLSHQTLRRLFVEPESDRHTHTIRLVLTRLDNLRMVLILWYIELYQLFFLSHFVCVLKMCGLLHKTNNNNAGQT